MLYWIKYCSNSCYREHRVPQHFDRSYLDY